MQMRMRRDLTAAATGTNGEIDRPSAHPPVRLLCPSSVALLRYSAHRPRASSQPWNMSLPPPPMSSCTRALAAAAA